jgi:KDO2-lipid IV(A) lauroyltransferase
MPRGSRPDLQDRLEYAALESLLVCLRVLPRRLAEGYARGLVRVLTTLVPIRRRVALDNLRRAFPDLGERDRRRIYRGMWNHLALLLVDFARYRRRPQEPMHRRHRLEHPERIDEALAAGRGLMILTGHFGNWEAIASVFSERGHDPVAVGARQRNPLVERMFVEYRAARGVRVLTVGKTLKPLVQALARGGVVGTLADQDGGADGFFLEFLGRVASVQSGLFRLIARRRVPLLPVFTLREGDGWRIVPGEILWPRDAGTAAEAEEEARRLAIAFTAALEAEVRAHPDHWFWLHRRWHTRPPGERASTAPPGLPITRS